MKHTLKKKLFYFTIIFIFGLYSCERELYEEGTANKKDIKMRKITLEELQQIPNAFNKIESIKKKQNALRSNRSIYDSVNDFTIDTDKIVLAEKDGQTYLTFGITRNYESGKTENLVLKPEIDGSFLPFLFKYDLTDDDKINILNGTPILDIASKTSSKYLESLNLDEFNAVSERSTICVTVTVAICTEGNHDNGQYPDGSACPANGTEDIIFCWDLGDAGGGEPDDGGWTDGGSNPIDPTSNNAPSGGGTGTGTATTPIITTPVLNIEDEPAPNENLEQFNLNQENIIADLNTKTNRPEVKARIIQLKNETLTIPMEQGTEYFTDENENDPYIVNNLLPSPTGIRFDEVFENSIIRLHSHHLGLEPVPSCEDIEGMIDFFSQKRLLGANDAINITSIIPTKNGIYALRITNPEKAEKTSAALNYSAFKDALRKRYTLKVRRKAQIDCNCVTGSTFDQLLLQNFINFLSNEDTGLAIYVATINQDGTLSWSPLP